MNDTPTLTGIVAGPIIRSALPWACIVRLGGVGDNLVASSVLPRLAEKYNVEVIAQAPYHVVFENNPYIAKLTVKQPGEIPGGEGWQQWFVDRAREYALFVNLSHSMETTLVFTKAQTQFHWPAAWRRTACDKSYLDFAHEIVGVGPPYSPRFYPTEAERHQALATKNKMGDRVIGWCLSGSRLDKSHPDSAIIIARLLQETKLPVVMFGAPGKEFEMARYIQEHVKRQNGGDHGLHLAMSSNADHPNWPLRRILSQVLACDLVIGPDTGPMWAVAMESIPKVLMLSHASPTNITRHWCNTTTLHADQGRVPCWPCHQLHDGPDTCRLNARQDGAACISDISIDRIVGAAKGLLSVTERD